jgi:EAL domain-containing protein (putative c-di-GMP-specific phosphodiesterase class I)
MESFESIINHNIMFNTGEVTGSEALIRWNHPERGLLYQDPLYLSQKKMDD